MILGGRWVGRTRWRAIKDESKETTSLQLWNPRKVLIGVSDEQISAEGGLKGGFNIICSHENEKSVT